MKTRYLMLLLGCLFLQLQSIFSQTENNSLYIPPTDCAVGSLATVPIMLSNDAEVVALQFDMHIPDVVRLADPGITMTDRKNGHTITVKNLGRNNYRVLVFFARKLRGFIPIAINYSKGFGDWGSLCDRVQRCRAK